MATSIVEVPSLRPEMLVEDYRKYKVTRLSGRSLATANWVTTLAHPCRAYAVYSRTIPAEKRRALPERLGTVFSEGDDQARAIKRDLLDMGYEVEGAEGQLSWPKYEITGRKDLHIRKIGAGRGVDAEIKSCSPFTFAGLNTPDDVWNHKYSFIVKWAKQVSLYMVLKAVEVYWMVLKDKSSGQIKILEFTLGERELQAANEMVNKAEDTNKLVKIGEMPIPAMKLNDVDLCSECEFFPVCLPDVKGPGAMILTDERAAELEVKTKRLLELKPIAKEYEDLDDEVKEEVKALAGEDNNAVVFGSIVANIKRSERKAFSVKASTQVRVSFVNTDAA